MSHLSVESLLSIFKQQTNSYAMEKYSDTFERIARAIYDAQRAAPSAQPAGGLFVVLSNMRESNGRVTWEVRLLKSGDAFWDGYSVYTDAIKGRAAYEADSLKHFLGLGPEPDMLAYDTDGPDLAQPAGAASTAAVRDAEPAIAIGAGDPMAFFADFCERNGYASDSDMDAALQGAFYEGIRYCSVHSPAASLAASVAQPDQPLITLSGITSVVKKDPKVTLIRFASEKWQEQFVNEMHSALIMTRSLTASVAQPVPDAVIERTEFIRLAHANFAAGRTRNHLVRDVECLLAHVALLSAAPVAQPSHAVPAVLTKPEIEDTIKAINAAMNPASGMFFPRGWNVILDKLCSMLNAPAAPVCQAVVPAQASEPVALSDADIEREFTAALGRWDGNHWVIEDADFYPFVRGIATPAQAQGEVAKKAARYDWLRFQGCNFVWAEIGAGNCLGGLDEAIDAAMSSVSSLHSERQSGKGEA